MDELTRTTIEIKSMLIALDQKMDKRFDALEGRMEARFGAMEARFAGVDARFGAVEARFDSLGARFETRFGGLETRTSQLFVAMITLQIMTLLAIIGGLFGIVTKLL